MRYATLLAVAVTLTLTACASTRGVDRLAFGEYLRAGYELSERELRALQYYVSDDIHLRRAVQSGNRSVGGPGIVYVNGVAYQAEPANAYTHLQVERKALARSEARDRVQPGRRLYDDGRRD